jgi:hypothetical protein
MAFLLMLQAEQLPMRFDEFSSIYDYQAHESVEFVQYLARATITEISAPALVPVPAAAWLLASALALLTWLRRGAMRE